MNPPILPAAAVFFPQSALGDIAGVGEDSSLVSETSSSIVDEYPFPRIHNFSCGHSESLLWARNDREIISRSLSGPKSLNVDIVLQIAIYMPINDKYKFEYNTVSWPFAFKKECPHTSKSNHNL